MIRLKSGISIENKKNKSFSLKVLKKMEEPEIKALRIVSNKSVNFPFFS